MVEDAEIWYHPGFNQIAVGHYKFNRKTISYVVNFRMVNDLQFRGTPSTIKNIKDAGWVIVGSL